MIINKLNSVSKDYFFTLEKIVKEINPFTTIFKSYDGSVDFVEFECFFNTNTFKIPTDIKNTSLNTAHKINTVYFETDEIFDLGELTYALNVNFLLYPHQLFRLKGFVNTNQNNTRYLIQSTGKHMIFTPVENNLNNTKSELVFIGLQLKTDTIKRILRPALVNSSKLIKLIYPTNNL